MEVQVLPGTLPPSPESIMAGGCGPALFNPCGLAVAANGEVFIADTGHHRLCVLDHSGVLRVLAGCGARGFADGAGLEAAFAHPCGLTIDSEGTLYVADCGNHRIRRVTPDGVVSTVAGNGSAAHRDGQGRAASFYNPCGITVDHRDTLYVADYSNNCVRVVSKGGVVATILCHEVHVALALRLAAA
jgi:sugar lactone lactonase YvrE